MTTLHRHFGKCAPEVHPRAFDVFSILARSLQQPLRDRAARRRISISLDGCPVVFSHKLNRGIGQTAFRLLVEPGAPCLQVSEQISHALRTLDELLTTLGWQSAAGTLNRVFAATFPSDSQLVNSWWGGMWLGMETSADRLEIRVYCNLRSGDTSTRWQRLADILGLFGDASCEMPFRRFMSRIAPHTSPVGLGIQVSESKVVAIRSYFGVHRPSVDVCLACHPNGSPALSQALQSFVELLKKHFGGLRSQSLTLGFDHVLGAEHALLDDPAGRMKADFSCQSHRSARSGLIGSLQPWCADHGFPWSCESLNSVESVFGCFDLEYVSLGTTSEVDHVTLYYKPSAH